jgi:AhpD family alkylhydroperoxidase
MRISEKPIEQYPWYLRPFFWNQKRKYGQVLKPALLWGRVPRLFIGVAILYGMLDRRRSLIDPALRSFVMLRVSQINGCRFCVDLNLSLLAKRADSLEKMEAVETWKESPLFDRKERVALEYAEAMTYHDRQVSDILMSNLQGFFNQDAIVELTGLIAFQNLSSKFNSALDVPSQGFCRLPSRL